MTADVETIVVGAGVVGLAVARALAEAGHGVLVLEQHALIGSETSSRNSEVIHAGIYYPPGSLRATLCVRGKELLYRFCAENNVPHARCGKLLVATHENQLPKLAAIKETAAKNGVTDLESIGGNAARALEPELSCVAALISPSTGVVDSHGLMLALEGNIEAHGGSVVLRCPVERIERTPQGRLPPRHRRRSAGRHHLHKSRPVRGTARLQARRNARLRRHVPAAGDLLRQGPVLRAFRVLALQAAYLSAPGRRLARPARNGRHRRALQVRPRHRMDCRASTTASCPRSSSKFLDFIRSYYPGLDATRLHPDYTGIRPKLVPRRRAGTGFCNPWSGHARAAGIGRPLWHREPGSHRLAGDRRNGGGDAAAAVARGVFYP